MNKKSIIEEDAKDMVPPQERYLKSIAISTKRIADMLHYIVERADEEEKKKF